MGRRPLLLIGMTGISVSLLLCAYGFSQATYQLSNEQIAKFDFSESEQLLPLADEVFYSDVEFKSAVKSKIEPQVFYKNDG